MQTPFTNNTLFRVNSVATRNAIPTTIDSIPITTDETIGMTIYVVARRTGGIAGVAGASAYFGWELAFSDVSGVIALVGSSPAYSININPHSWGGVSYTITGSNIDIQVTGAIDTNINWRSYIHPKNIK